MSIENHETKVVSLQVRGNWCNSAAYKEVFTLLDATFQVTIIPSAGDACIDVWSRRAGEWKRVHSLFAAPVTPANKAPRDGTYTAEDFKPIRDELVRVAVAVVFM